MAQLEDFELKSYGDVKVTTHKPTGRIETTFYGVPKSVMCKLLSAKKPPELSDLECWIKEARGKKKDNSIVEAYNFWERDE
jgi:hypothetical protein